MITLLLIGALICFLIIIFLLEKAPEYEETEEGAFKKVIPQIDKTVKVPQKYNNNHYNLKKANYFQPSKMLLSFTYFLRRIF